MITEKQLREAANELNDVLGLDPKINVKKSSVEVLTEKIKEATDLIDPDQDEFTEPTQKVIDELTGKAEDEDEEEEEAPKAKGKKAPAKKEEEEEDEDDEDDEDEDEDEDEDDEEADDDEPTLRAQVTDAEDLEELKEIAKANSEFKSLVKTLKTYTKAKVLRPAMLELLEDEDEEAEKKADAIAKKNVGSKKPTTGKAKKEEDDDDEEEEKPKAKKKSSPVKSAGKDGGPGIIQTIVGLVEKAGKKGISKKEILEVLKENFPDRNEVSMKNTVNVQVPARINKEKFPIKKVGDDRYTKA